MQDHGPSRKLTILVFLPNFSMTLPSPLRDKNCILCVMAPCPPPRLPLKFFQGATFTPQAAKMKNLVHLHFYLAGSEGIMQDVLAGFLNANCNRGISRRINHDQKTCKCIGKDCSCTWDACLLQCSIANPNRMSCRMKKEVSPHPK